MTKAAFLMAFLCLLAGLSAQSMAANWQLWKGYTSVANITVNSWAGNYAYTSGNVLNVGNMSYVYVILPNMINSQYIVFSGYNATEGFVGNITGVTYDNGFIISNHTILGKAYNTITAYYNPNVTNSKTTTYAFNNYFANGMSNYTFYCSNPIESLLVYEGQHDNDFSTSPSGICQNYTSSVYAGYIYANFFLNKTPYFITASNRTFTNFSLEYIPYSFGAYRDTLSITNTLDMLTNYNTFSKQNVTAPVSAISSIFIDPNKKAQYQLIANGIGLYGVASACYSGCNGAIFNITTAKANLGGVFLPVIPYQLTLYYSNITLAGFSPRVSYIMFPYYTANYIMTYNTVSPINPPIINSLNCTSSGGWYCDFNYRLPITNIAWTYNFSSLAAPTSNTATLGILQNITLNNVGYALLTLPRYSFMNPNGLYLRAFDNSTRADYGVVPYTLVNSTGSVIRIIVRNITLSDYGYNSLYVYYDSPSGLSGFSNSSINNAWQPIKNSHVFSYSNTPYIVSLSNPINLASHLTFPNQPTTFGEQTNTHGTSDYLKMPLEGDYFINSSYLNNTKILEMTTGTGTPVIDYYFVARSISFYVPYINCPCFYLQSYLYNTTTSKMAYVSPTTNFTMTANLINLNGTIQKPYSTTYILGIPQIRTNNTGNAGATPVPPTPTGLNVSGLYKNSTFTLNNYNSIMTGLGLNVMVNWNGFIMPEYVINILIIIIAIVILAASKSEEGVIIGIAMLYIGDIYQLELLPVSVIITLVFLVYHTARKHKG